MSQEDVEFVRASIESYGTGDRDAYLEFVAGDVEICPDVSRFPEAQPFRGREEFKRFIADIDQGFVGGGTAVIREVFPVADRVLARFEWGGKGWASGIDVRSGLTWHLHRARREIVKIEFSSTTPGPRSRRAAGVGRAPLSADCGSQRRSGLGA